MRNPLILSREPAKISDPPSLPGRRPDQVINLRVPLRLQIFRVPIDPLPSAQGNISKQYHLGKRHGVFKVGQTERTSLACVDPLLVWIIPHPGENRIGIIIFQFLALRQNPETVRISLAKCDGRLGTDNQAAVPGESFLSDDVRTGLFTSIIPGQAHGRLITPGWKFITDHTPFRCRILV